MSVSLSHLIVPGVMWLLVLFSVVTWALLLIKIVHFRQQKRESQRFQKAFWNSQDFLSATEHASQYPGALARVTQSAVSAMTVDPSPRTAQQLAYSINQGERLERHLRHQIQRERRSLETGLTVLASIGSTAPFVGLFGTVWGIMEALQSIGLAGAASMETVAGPVGHALQATGVGIAVAVPAVLVYNYFLRRLKLSVYFMEDFAHDFYSLAQSCGFSVTRQSIAQDTRALRKVG
ncbi:MotA/TolQ/ExbB proton channel family protein [Xylophilus ampelinus]|uniref:Outer membrane transport energization protein ExbB n=1 Tax=Xylophilus ampelinus TaxID=54067 RepID=A0A318SH10_9BURK|nr:MotA/TolQ/ExbB proton channel family protein [Xylophilus ampelinus]MCS4510452.1 MotA/TolQ/ExbB proton channel family protein [Xylophilus ampelinus]PYE77905.1 outer membrane transport energization protein ExbB [Xylophilus ampelinus]